uniref:Homeobox protein aprd5-like mw n=1 Tax=Saccoglossus kowalevskii TaxID=10224 RepID=A0A0U2T5W2_SACKO|nr:homeobox protein aprd5-like mw [Saccoglossus kowalevskii]
MTSYQVLNIRDTNSMSSYQTPTSKDSKKTSRHMVRKLRSAYEDHEQLSLHHGRAGTHQRDVNGDMKELQMTCPRDGHLASVEAEQPKQKIKQEEEKENVGNSEKCGIDTKVSTKLIHRHSIESILNITSLSGNKQGDFKPRDSGISLSCDTISVSRHPESCYNTHTEVKNPVFDPNLNCDAVIPSSPHKDAILETTRLISEPLCNDQDPCVEDDAEKNPVGTDECDSGLSASPSTPKASKDGSPHTSPGSTNGDDQYRKPRTIFKVYQVTALEEVFERTHYPDQDLLEWLAEKLEIPEPKVKVWFQNKRARWKKRTENDLYENDCSPVPYMGSPAPYMGTPTPYMVNPASIMVSPAPHMTNNTWMQNIPPTSHPMTRAAAPSDHHPMMQHTMMPQYASAPMMHPMPATQFQGPPYTAVPPYYPIMNVPMSASSRPAGMPMMTSHYPHQTPM